MSVLVLSVIGGLVSAISTSTGSFIAPLFTKIERLRKYQMSMDFGLGVMLSAVAFSLVGPELVKGQELSLVFSGLIAGSVFIYVTHKAIEKFNAVSLMDSSKVLLIAALILHNLPEGMAAGASLAGMDLHEAMPLQVAIAVQNVPEGLLLTLLLQGLGLGLNKAVLGGVISGLVEMTGAVIAGIFMQDTAGLLPFFLSLAGGAMMMSVFQEVHESMSLGKKFEKLQFMGGMMLIPLTNLLLQ